MKALSFLLLLAICLLTAGQSTDRKSDELTRPGSVKFLTDWMDVHLKAIRNHKIPNHHTRQLGYTGIALYESIVGATPDYQSLAGQLTGYNYKPDPPDKEISWQASANAAIATALRYFYTEPVNLKRIDSMEQASKKMLLSHGFNQASVDAGSAYGNKVAMAVIDWSKSDGADKISAPYTVPTGDGYWEPTPPGFSAPVMPYLGNCRTFVKGSIDKTIPPPPTTFSKEPGSEFYKMVDEVYQASLQKDEKNKALALYWDDFPNGLTLTAGGHWESILKTVITQLNLSLIEGARVFAGLYIAMQDAAVGCFKAKYTYNMMRPVTYVQKYMNHKDWNPLIATPTHPEYPAAHATISMSAATMLTHLLGDNIAFTDNTYAYRNYPDRQYANFKAAGTDAGMSRFYGGIHYKPSIQAGFKQGEQIANNVAKGLVFKKTTAEK
jgi:hypothetical protein